MSTDGQEIVMTEKHCGPLLFLFSFPVNSNTGSESATVGRLHHVLDLSLQVSNGWIWRTKSIVIKIIIASCMMK